VRPLKQLKKPRELLVGDRLPGEKFQKASRQQPFPETGIHFGNESSGS